MASPRRVTVAPVAAGVAASGAVLVVVAFTTLAWFRPGPGQYLGEIGGAHSTFGNVADFISAGKAKIAREGLSGLYSFGAADAYFHWLGWVFLLFAIVATGIAVSSLGAAHWSLSWLAAVIDLVGGGMTIVSLSLVSAAGNAPETFGGTPSFGEWVKHGSWGAWCAVAGFAAMFVAALLPHPRR